MGKNLLCNKFMRKLRGKYNELDICGMMIIFFLEHAGEAVYLCIKKRELVQ